VIDAPYRGQIHVTLFNHADLPRTEPCAVCKDVGKVSVPVATQWILDQGKRQGT
jgi:hypothetical protein